MKKLHPILTFNEYLSQHLTDILAFDSVVEKDIVTVLNNDEYCNKIRNDIKLYQKSYEQYHQRQLELHEKYNSLVKNHIKNYTSFIPVFIRQILAFFTTIPFSIIAYPIAYLFAWESYEVDSVNRFFKKLFLQPTFDAYNLFLDITYNTRNLSSVEINLHICDGASIMRELFDYIMAEIIMMPVYELCILTVIFDAILLPLEFIWSIPQFIISGHMNTLKKTAFYFTKQEHKTIQDSIREHAKTI